ncbi:PAS domain-containing protein [Algoriphagus persicinus]|uniref:PAS domain-containing protein n=1 Tax=Algoriphagus persicinus TaxID=3108754 RepID=UPI002B39DF8E|nr:PAS domain S-box protein [Algoriphagus sp. E1-3-M2]MEB2783955.1 PAS domain S-box protein [Algoriphagus sp. E1-3-M2]
MSKAKIFSINRPWVITVLYLIVGINYIFFSDILLTSIFSDNISEISRFQMIKGCLYVLVTGLLLYFLIKRLYDKVNGGKQELELLFTNPNLGILKIDKNGYFTYTSPNILEIIGYTVDEIIGKNIIDLTPQEFVVQDREKFEKIAEYGSKKGFIINKYLQDKQGNTIIVKLYGITLKNKEDEVIGYLAAFQNITDQETFLKSLEAKNRQLRELATDQSHLVRAPLARILGIIELMQGVDLESSEKVELITHLKTSGEELDEALKDISHKMSKRVSN